MIYSLYHLHILLLLNLFFVSNSKTVEKSRERFVKWSIYLSLDGGRWMTQNPEYDSSNQLSPRAFEMHYNWDEERQVLWSDVIIEFKEFQYVSQKGLHRWHPFDRQVEYISYCYNGGLIQGATSWATDSLFTTAFEQYQPDGRHASLKDEYKIVTKNIQSNIPFEYKDGKWVPLGTYEWKRVIKPVNEK